MNSSVLVQIRRECSLENNAFGHTETRRRYALARPVAWAGLVCEPGRDVGFAELGFRPSIMVSDQTFELRAVFPLSYSLRLWFAAV
jgi:hypothetical protein